MREIELNYNHIQWLVINIFIQYKRHIARIQSQSKSWEQGMKSCTDSCTYLNLLPLLTAVETKAMDIDRSVCLWRAELRRTNHRRQLLRKQSKSHLLRGVQRRNVRRQVCLDHHRYQYRNRCTRPAFLDYYRSLFTKMVESKEQKYVHTKIQ